MTISKAQLEEAYHNGRDQGRSIGREEAKKELLAIRQEVVVGVAKAISELAMANAKLTYAVSRITDKLL